MHCRDLFLRTTKFLALSPQERAQDWWQWRKTRADTFGIESRDNLHFSFLFHPLLIHEDVFISSVCIRCTELKAAAAAVFALLHLLLKTPDHNVQMNANKNLFSSRLLLPRRLWMDLLLLLLSCRRPHPPQNILTSFQTCRSALQPPSIIAFGWGSAAAATENNLLFACSSAGSRTNSHLVQTWLTPFVVFQVGCKASRRASCSSEVRKLAIYSDITIYSNSLRLSNF